MRYRLLGRLRATPEEEEMGEGEATDGDHEDEGIAYATPEPSHWRTRCGGDLPHCDFLGVSSGVRDTAGWLRCVWP